MPSEHKTNETIKYKLAAAMKECMKSASVEDYRHGDCGDLRRDTPDLLPEF